VTKIDIISGFLGAGKTTLIKKLLDEALSGEKVALIENEFGEVGIDGPILKKYGIEIKEMNSGCICCTIAGDFSLALKELLVHYHPDRIIIEPSGVGKLSDIIKGCEKYLKKGSVELSMCITVIDAMKYKVYLKNFREFYENQLANAKTIILSRSQNMNEKAIESILDDIKKHNPKAHIMITDWKNVSGKKIVELAESSEEIPGLKTLLEQTGHAHDHNHCHNHHADEVFHVWGKETAKTFERNELNKVLNSLDNVAGNILRAKGIVRSANNKWLQFDYVPKEVIIRDTTPDCIGRICVIGEHINENVISKMFGL
jgi:G3E family GTPase